MYSATALQSRPGSWVSWESTLGLRTERTREAEEARQAVLALVLNIVKDWEA